MYNFWQIIKNYTSSVFSNYLRIIKSENPDGLTGSEDFY